MDRDLALDALLQLHGQVLVIDPDSNHWVKFVVRRVPVTNGKPHGLDYSLTLHGPDGASLVGFDNAHPVSDGPSGAFDHRHRLKVVRAYDYAGAAELLADFWTEVENVLREKGIVT